MTENIELDWLKQWGQYTPEKLAIYDVDQARSYSYQDLYQAAIHLQPYLDQLQISQGDRVAVFAQNAVETILLFFALQRRAAILVPVNFRLSARELDYILQDAGAKCCFYDSSGESSVKPLLNNHNFRRFEDLVKVLDVKSISQLKLQQEPVRKSLQPEPMSKGLLLEPIRTSLQPEPMHMSEENPHDVDKTIRSRSPEMNDPCMILYTSGTTGHPKGVVVTHKMLFWNSVNTTISLDLSSKDRMVSFLPLFHTGGWNVLLTPFLHRGASIFFMKAFCPEKIIELCDSEQITILFGVPTTLARMMKTDNFDSSSLSSLRFAVVGGEPMPLELIRTWQGKGVLIRQGFGLTECGPNCFSLRAEDAESKLGSIGRPNFYVQTRVVTETLQDAEPNEIGELWLRGPMCMSEYWQNPKATEEAFFEGWLKTGDLVRFDQDGLFYVVGRKKEMFISGGENVYPIEVEKVLQAHPAIDEVAVIGVADESWGEVGRAYVVLKSGKTETAENLAAFCSQNLARFKVPKQFDFLPELPKGSTGKILKSELNK